jgi:hypothetical protein
MENFITKIPKNKNSYSENISSMRTSYMRKYNIINGVGRTSKIKILTQENFVVRETGIGQQHVSTCLLSQIYIRIRNDANGTLLKTLYCIYIMYTINTISFFTFKPVYFNQATILLQYYVF